MRGVMTRKTMRLRAGFAGAVSLAMLVPVAMFAGSGFARGSASAAQYQYKLTICHHAGPHGKMHTIRISSAAWKAHRKHGDTVGACPAAVVPAPGAQQKAPKHGKPVSHGNGNAGSNSNAGVPV